MYHAGITIKNPPIVKQAPLRYLCTILLCLASFHSHAQLGNQHTEVYWQTGFSDLVLEWHGSGDLIGSSTACIHSNRSPGNSGKNDPFEYGVMGTQTGTGDFLAGDGANDIVLQLSYENVALAEGVLAGIMFPGSTGCQTVSLDVLVPEAQLLNLPNGSYTTDIPGQLEVCATERPRGGQCGDDLRRASNISPLSITININPYTRLFNVGDFNLPAYDGVSSLVSQDMQFCVRSTASSAGYMLTASSDTHHTDVGDFAVINNGAGGETIPYTLSFDASINPGAGNALTSGVAVGPFTGSRQNECGGGNNASMQVQVNGSDIRQVAAGNYSGVITIKVEPN